MKNLKEITEKIINQYEFKDNKKISIYLRMLNGEEFYNTGENQIVNSASCIKVAILIAVLEKVKSGEINLNQVIDFKDKQLNDYNGIYSEIKKVASLEELLTFMIIYSDNMATNVLIDLYGFEYYNDYFKKIGLTNTVLNRYMGSYNLNKENFTTQRDMYIVFRKIFNYEILDKKLCNIAQRILKMQRIKKISQRYIFQDIKVYHKDGALQYLGLKNDCGVFEYNGNFYYFGYFIEGIKNNEDAAIIIGRLFKNFYCNFITND